MSTGFRVGIGYDVHRLEEGLPLLLAGVQIPSDLGARARTDGDVVLHALIDALLGAAALGDIGGMFPETDDRFLGADSSGLLEQALGRVRGAGFAPVNVDVNVIAETPRLRPHYATMRDRLSALLGLPLDRVSVKARSAEGMGEVGEKRAIQAQVVVLLEEEAGRA
jgi:2-C-methyl-D-erythritol 2,4-cyclodiphosphate synthase